MVIIIEPSYFERFQEAAKVVNGIPIDKFPVLLNRIIQKLHLKVHDWKMKHIYAILVMCADSGLFLVSQSVFFSPEEEDQLKSMLELSDKDLKTTLDCCSYIYEQV